MSKVERGTLYFPGKDGAAIGVQPLNGKAFTYEELSCAVNGYIETMIPAAKGHRIYVNEEGALKLYTPNWHTWTVVKESVYRLNGYASTWRVAGRILEVFKTDDLSADTGRVLIAQAVKL